MKVIDKNSVQKSSNWRYGQPLLRKLTGGSQQGLLFKLKNCKPYDFYKYGSAMPENKRFKDTKKNETTYIYTTYIRNFALFTPQIRLHSSPMHNYT